MAGLSEALTVAVPIGTGLAWLAYQHPTAYGKWYVGMHIAAWVVFLALSIFSIGFSAGAMANGAENPISVGWITAALFVFSIYITILLFLPRMQDKG